MENADAADASPPADPLVPATCEATPRAPDAPPPVEGAANEELIAFVAKALGVARRDVTIVGGAQSRQKRLRIDGLDAATVEARLVKEGG